MKKGRDFMKRKRLLSAVLAGIFVVSMLGGCASAVPQGATETTQGGAQETDRTSGTVKLRVWAEESTYDALNKMIDSFKEEYKGQATFDITLEQNADSDTRDNVLGDVHNAADVFILADDQVASMAAGGALYPVPNADEVKKANVEGAIDAATVDDTLYAYPMTADNGYFLYYNKKYLSDSDVKTLDGILKVAEKNHKKFMMDWSSGWYLYSFFGNTGLDFGINDDNVTNHCEWNSTEGDIKGVDIAQAMLDISSSSGFENAVNEDFIKGAKKGSVIAGVSGVWSETELKKIWGNDIGAAKLPTYTVAGKQVQMASFTGYKLMGVSAYSANPQWAAKLADWLTNEQNQTVRFEMNGQGPSNTKAADSDAVKASPSIQAVIAQSEFGKLQRVGNSYWDASKEFGNTMAAGNPNHVKLQELMDNLVNGITKSVAG
jgi:carbohydrate ABC transporter substrate-binding protein, CUT1 family (TC 3.A.1.1.-)